MHHFVVVFNRPDGGKHNFYRDAANREEAVQAAQRGYAFAYGVSNPEPEKVLECSSSAEAALLLTHEIERDQRIQSHCKDQLVTREINGETVVFDKITVLPTIGPKPGGKQRIRSKLPKWRSQGVVNPLSTSR